MKLSETKTADKARIELLLEQARAAVNEANKLADKYGLHVATSDGAHFLAEKWNHSACWEDPEIWESSAVQDALAEEIESWEASDSWQSSSAYC